MQKSDSYKFRHIRGEAGQAEMTATSLDTRCPSCFVLAPDKASRLWIAEDLDVLDVLYLRFSGQIATVDQTHEWRLAARLSSRVVQRCILSLEPVRCIIETQVERRYLGGQAAVLPGTDGCIPDDLSVEPLPPIIDLYEIVRETLILEMPEYPRKSTAETFVHSTSCLEDEGQEMNKKPFAMLGKLRKSS